MEVKNILQNLFLGDLWITEDEKQEKIREANIPTIKVMEYFFTEGLN